MKKTFVFVVILSIFVAARHSTCSLSPTKTARAQGMRIMTFHDAKKELKRLLVQRKKMQEMKERASLKLKRATSAKHVAIHTLRQLRGELNILRKIEENLTDSIAQLMTQHPGLMKYLPSDVGFLPVLPFLPVVPIRLPTIPHI